MNLSDEVFGQAPQEHTLIQGTPEWHAFRLEHDGASEAAAMLCLSKKTKRNELLYQKHTGLAKEFSDWVQEHILDPGHEVEAKARPLVEEIIGKDLYPVTYSRGRLSASCDGLTLNRRIAFEHKQWNKEYAALVMNNEFPEEHMPQCQQVLLVTGAEMLYFVISDGTPNNLVYIIVYPDPVWFERIIDGWVLFHKDLDVYVPPEVIAKPQAEVIMQLPALSIQVRGEVTTSNMDDFAVATQAYLAGINTQLVTDQDFVNAEAHAKECRTMASKLDLTKEAMLSQTVTIGEAVRKIDAWKEEYRLMALQLEKDVVKEKEARRLAILNAAKLAYAEHVAALEVEIEPIRLVLSAPDFAGAMKGKKSIKGWQDAADDALMNARMAADAAAKDIRAKLTWYNQTINTYFYLCHDLQIIIQKPVDDFKLLVTTRIDAHKKAEADKLEAERVRIQQEEEAKAKAKVEAEAERAAAEAKAAEAKKTPDPTPTPTPAPTATTIPATLRSAPAKLTEVARPVAQADTHDRPADALIIATLALRFSAPEEKVIQWLMGMDLEGALERLEVAA
jgi:predicted phage-related endonuclease